MVRSKKLSIGLTVVLAIFTLTLLVATRAAAQQESVLYSFNYPNGTDGQSPGAGLAFDANGNLYGTTLGGGVGAGTVFELMPVLGGGWTEKILYNFAGGKDGFGPQARLILDASGNFYGTTVHGGGLGGCNLFCGTVFELSPAGGGSWKEKVLHSFNGQNGGNPQAGLILDASGDLYGTTYDGGAHGYGTVFELIPAARGKWKEKVLHTFNSTPKGKDGFYPQAGLIFDGSGNLYGTTIYGGTGTCAPEEGITSCGIIFELTPTLGGSWKEKVLHDFKNDGTDGAHPEGSLIFDASGNLYGAAYEGGYPTVKGDECYPVGCGVVFELTPAGGGWASKALYNFYGNFSDGIYPQDGLIFDASGNLYGTTLEGGPVGNSEGTAFKLTPAEGGSWTETVLHNFMENGTDGFFPLAGLLFDSAGNLYGTTLGGGPLGGVCGGYGCGTVFEITP
jgi:uncharacterized repeat protein (TIGR03803 family)